MSNTSLATGRRHRPTQALRRFVVERLTAQVKIADVAGMIGISLDTFRKHYAEEMKAAGVKPGQPKHEPTERTRLIAFQHALVGVPKEDIAKEIGIGVSTLLNHYERELDRGLNIANAKVAGKIYSKAIEGDTLAAIFWLKTRAGFKEAGQSNEGTAETIADALSKLAGRLPGG